jgi:hypothetical protein
MALTRAVSDFKDSVKAATTTNITLSGGAPTTVDGISLSANDSVLVRSQTDTTQNGLYRVTTLGTGANGTWTRRSDFNASNQVSAGALIFVEQGTTNGNVFYYLPGGVGTVSVGSTALNFSNLFSTITGSGSSYGNTQVAAYLPTYSSTLTASTITTLNGGQITGYHTGAIGANTANTGVFTSVTTTSAGQITGYHTGAIGANTANTGVFTSVTTTSAGQITGYHTGAIGANTANSGAFTTLTATSTIADSIGDVRNIPQNSQVAGYTLLLSDNGKHISITTGGVTVPASVFSAGNSVVIFNNSASSQTITQGTSVTMYLAGTATTGNRTLAQRGLCTILCYAANSFVISGSVT